jgi:peptidoglycan/xylan/chitin deacetylase (PgdA/CDA1 family)
MRLCAISVDLDEIPNYFKIHGLPEPSWPTANLVYEVAVERLRDFAAAVGVPLTLFAIGSDLQWPDAAKRLRAAADAGCEIGNHTLDHKYDLTRLDREGMRRQIEEGRAAIEAATGQRPVGFRAPGYTITDQVFDVLRELDVAYDSSVFPCPPYWLAKAAAITAIGLQGRQSHSVVDTPKVLLAPRRPYRAGRPYWRRGDGVLELPIQVTPGPRAPVIGTTLTMAGPLGARVLAKVCAREPLVNLELHGIDVLDATEGLQALVQHQPDVTVPKDRKLDSLAAFVNTLKKSGYTFVTLREAAEHFAGKA